MKISELAEFVDKTVTLRVTDGEVAKVRVDFISEEDEDIIVDVLESTRLAPYDPSCAYLFEAADIVSAEAANEPVPVLPPIDPTA
jgi:hypothetical protein